MTTQSLNVFSTSIKSMYSDHLKCTNRMKKYYFDNNSTTWIPDDILRYYLEYVNCGNPSNTHHASGRISAKAIESSKIMIARDLDVNVDDIVFTACATESNNAVIQGIIHAHIASDKPLHILSSAIEHKCVLETIQKMVDSDNRNLISFDVIPVGKDGAVSWGDVENLLKEETGLVCIMYANNESGVVQPVERIGVKLRRHRPDIHFHVDAVAAMGKRIIHPSKFCSSLSFSGHKIHAVKGIGCLYVDQKAMSRIQPLTFGGRQQVIRSGTDNTGAIWCLANALIKVHHNRKKKNDKLWNMRNWILEKFKNAGLKYRIFGSSKRKNQLENTLLIAFHHKEMCNLKLVKYLDSVGISVSIGSSCNTSSAKASHVLEAMGADNNDRRGTIRITMSDYTSMSDCEHLVKHIITAMTRPVHIPQSTSISKPKNISQLTSLSSWTGGTNMNPSSKIYSHGPSVVHTISRRRA